MEPTHTNRAKHKLEMVQRRAARYCANRYHNTSSVTEMLDLQLETLESRLTKIQLTRLFNIDIPVEEYLSPASTRTRALHSEKRWQYPDKSDAFKYNLRTIPTCNSLPATLAEAPDLVHLKQGLCSLTEQWRIQGGFRGFA